MIAVRINGMIEILFIVFWVIGVVFFWGAGPWANWPWAPHAYYMLLFALLGLAMWFDRVGVRILP